MGIVTAHELTVRKGGRAILDGVSLSLEPEHLTAILGPNGAGKSTLLRCLAGSLRSDSGEVRIGAVHMADVPASELARRRAVLTQENSLGFAFSVFEVVQLGRTPHAGRSDAATDRQAVLAALEAAGVAHLAGRDFTTLSGGEKQRVHLARALAQIWPFRGSGGDKFLLLDEPTNNLDLAHQHRLLGFARRLAEDGLAVAAVLHDPNLASAYAHRVAILKDGRKVADGPVAEVMRADAVSDVYGIDLRLIGETRTRAPLLFADA